MATMRVRHRRMHYFPPKFKEAALMVWGKAGPVRTPGGHGPYWRIIGHVISFLPVSERLGVAKSWFN
jgi:hypothetical protein